MKVISSILLLLMAVSLQAQDLESVELKASDLVTGNAENDLIALAETAKIARKPVVVMAPDSWRQQIAGLLRKAWPQVEIKLRKSPSGKMKAWLLQPEQKSNPKALAPEIKLPEEKPKTDFAVQPVTETSIQSVAEIGQNTLKTPGLVPLGKPAPAIRTTQQPASSTKLRSLPHQSVKNTGDKSDSATPGHAMVADEKAVATEKTPPAHKPIQTRSRKFVSQHGTESSKPRQEDKPHKVAKKVDAPVPVASETDPVASERQKLERIYNKGKTVKKKITVDKLKLNDVLYVWPHNTLVARKSGATRRHFWLTDRERLKLDQPAIRDEGNHLYRIRGKLKITP